ncbi:MAG TPA: hypothetical protein ENH11_02290, partial [Candidatus Acetothermia bacterium]|nr:hypothetical protein [Candidatus Acetothermia bacterium]
MQRRKARELVLHLLYAREFVDTPLAKMISEHEDTNDQSEYVEETLRGVVEYLADLDDVINR